MTEGRCKTFLATNPLAGGVVRVVLLQHANGNWAAYISTDVSMSVASILKIVSDRWSIEEHFHDVKEIWGAGEQQVRNVWSSIGCWHVCGWLYALVELASWHGHRILIAWKQEGFEEIGVPGGSFSFADQTSS